MLKPCPFCGRPPDTRLEPGRGFQVYCSNGLCSVKPKTQWAVMRKMGLANWNRRKVGKNSDLGNKG